MGETGWNVGSGLHQAEEATQLGGGNLDDVPVAVVIDRAGRVRPVGRIQRRTFLQPPSGRGRPREFESTRECPGQGQRGRGGWSGKEMGDEGPVDVGSETIDRIAAHNGTPLEPGIEGVAW